MASFIDKLKSKEIPAKKVFYKANVVIFSEMEPARGMYLIESGRGKNP